MPAFEALYHRNTASSFTSPFQLLVSKDKYEYHIAISLARELIKVDVVPAVFPQGAAANDGLPHTQIPPNENLLLH